jgi:hypothetical protein
MWRAEWIALQAKRATIVPAAAAVVEAAVADEGADPKESAKAKILHEKIKANDRIRSVNHASRVTPRASVSFEVAVVEAGLVALAARIRAAAKRRTTIWMTTAWKRLSWTTIKTIWSFPSTAKMRAAATPRPVMIDGALRHRSRAVRVSAADVLAADAAARNRRELHMSAVVVVAELCFGVYRRTHFQKIFAAWESVIFELP